MEKVQKKLPKKNREREREMEPNETQTAGSA